MTDIVTRALAHPPVDTDYVDGRHKHRAQKLLSKDPAEQIADYPEITAAMRARGFGHLMPESAA